MNEKPILFKPELVRRILDGEKTETRRIIKPQPDHILHYGSQYIPMMYPKNNKDNIKCPFGTIGNILWVRETWTKIDDSDQGFEPFYVYKADNLEDKYPGEWQENQSKDPKCGRWKPSIHMPKDACRLRLKIKDISVERIQDITDAGIKAEGIQPHTTIKDMKVNSIGMEVGVDGELHMGVNGTCTQYDHDYRTPFIETWDKINKKRGYGWNTNCYVWVIKFERVE